MIVLDTHAWIWMIDSPGMLGRRAQLAIEQARTDRNLYVSCISTWEVYMLCQRNRLQFVISPEVWIARCEQLSFLHFIPVDNHISRLAVQLSGTFDADPADRLIVATAQFLGATLITQDKKIRAYKGVKSLWS